MSEKRFKVCIDSNNGVGLFDNSVKLLFVKFTNKEDALSCKDSLKHHCNLMNELYNENEQLKKSEKINMEYAEQIVKENQKLRIAKNDLRFKKMDTIIDPFPIWDTVEEKGYNCTDTLDLLVDLLNKLYEENERLRNQLERKTILLKIRTKHMDDREKSFQELLNYLESFCYKSNIDGNYAKQDIINILNNWEIRGI